MTRAAVLLTALTCTALVAITNATDAYDAESPTADHYAAATRFYESGDSAKALVAFRAAAEFAPSTTNWYNLGSAALELSEEEVRRPKRAAALRTESYGAFDEALRLDPTNADASSGFIEAAQADIALAAEMRGVRGAGLSAQHVGGMEETGREELLEGWKGRPRPPLRDCWERQRHTVRVSEAERLSGAMRSGTHAAVLASLQRCGIVKIVGAFNNSDVDESRADIAAFRKADRGRRSQLWIDGLRSATNERLGFGTPCREPHRGLAKNPVLLPVLKEYLLGDARVEWAETLVTLPGAISAQEAHLDEMPTSMIKEGFGCESENGSCGHFKRHRSSLLCMSDRWSSCHGYSLKMQVSLSEVTADMGALHMCPSTHHEDVLAYREIDDEFLRSTCDPPLEATVGEGEEGAAWIYDSRLAHFGGANLGEKERIVTSFHYTTRLFNDISRPMSEESLVHKAHWGRIEL